MAYCVARMGKEISVNALYALVGVALLATVGWAQDAEESAGDYPDPARFEEVVQEFEKEASKQRVPRKAIVCTGSSSMRGWHDDLYDDLAPLTVIARGFGGSNMNDVLFYADRLILPYRPRAVVLYEGDNDIAQGIAPETILETFHALLEKVHAELPKTRFYVLSIKPSPSRWHMWSRMQRANELLAQACAEDERLTYVDVASGMLGEDGEPRGDIFEEDKLHMNRKGYELWRDALRPVIIKAEWPRE